jgi:hypothetical protein
MQLEGLTPTLKTPNEPEWPQMIQAVHKDPGRDVSEGPKTCGSRAEVLAGSTMHDAKVTMCHIPVSIYYIIIKAISALSKKSLQ